MAKLKFRNDVPPSGWWFIDQKSKLRIDGESFPDVTQKVIAHRKYKSIPGTDPDEVALEVERQICSRLGTYHCKPESPEDIWTPVEVPSTMIKLNSVLSFSKAMFEWVSSGRELVTEEKAKARAAKCAACPINWPLTGCKCGAVMTMIQSAVPKAKQLPDLGVCMVCECSLPAKVWLPRNVIDASNQGRNLQFPKDGSCWQFNEANDPQG